MGNPFSLYLAFGAYMNVSWNSWILDTPSFIFISSNVLIGSAGFLTIIGDTVAATYKVIPRVSGLLCNCTSCSGWLNNM